jgi:carbon monoxide dehydrogenase subunit G
LKLEQSFEVSAPLDRVWEALVDVERVAPNLPGAAITGRNDDGTYNGTFTIKIGPTTAAYTGKLEMETVDESTHTATMQAQGTDRRGQGGAKATIISKLSPAGEGATRVEVDTDYHITGRLARFGRGGMIEDISERLLREFASRLQASLAGAQSAEPVTQPVEHGAPASEAPVTAAEPPPTEAPQEPAAVAGEGPALADAEPQTESSAAVPPPTGAAATSPPAASEPIEGLSLVGSVMLDRVRRNPQPLLAALGLFLLLRLLRRKR